MKSVTKKIRFLKFVRFHTVVITIFAAFLLLKDNLWFQHDMPDKNFISLIMTRTHMDQCIDTGCLGEYTIQDLGMSTASGLAIGTFNDKTYILTANHFCNSDEYSLILNPGEGYIVSKIHVSDVVGNIWSSEIVYSDLRSDLCFGVGGLRSEGLREGNACVRMLSAPSRFPLAPIPENPCVPRKSPPENSPFLSSA